MGTTAEKLTYLNETKTKLKDMLNLGGASLTTEPFRQYVDTLKNRYLYFINNGTQEVWDNWEKVVGEGTTITLNNTEEAPMKINLKGNTSQAGTPTPETPQDIHVVSGDNSIVVCGKNLLKNKAASQTINGVVFTVYDDGSVKAEGTATANTALPITGANNVFVDLGLQNGTYRLSGAIGGAENTWAIYMAIKHSDNTTATFYNTNGDLVFAKTTGDTFFSVIRIENGTTVNQMFYPMIRVSSVLDDTYEPYKGESYPISLGDIELCKIGTYQDSIKKSTGKNLLDLNRTLGQPSDTTAVNTTKRLFNYNKVIKGISGTNYYYPQFISSYSIENQTISLTTGATATYGLGFPIKIEANTTYTMSFDKSSTNARVQVSYYTSDGTYINYESKTASFTFTTPSNCDFILINFTGNETNTTYTFTNCILNEGTTATSYEPYGTSWYVKKEIGKVVLNGSENWKLNSSSGDSYRYWLKDTTSSLAFTDIFTNIISGAEATLVGKLLCNYFTQKIFEQTYMGAFSINVGANENKWFLLNVSETSLENFKNWLSTHNTIVYYVLATPTYTEITDSTLLSQLEVLLKARSYDGQTNITQTNNDLPFIINATALKEMA